MKIFNVSPEDRYEEQSELYEDSSFEDASLTADVIDCLIDGIHEYGQINIDTYRAIHEASGEDNIICITESVSEMFDKFKKWIMGLLKKIKEFILKFLAKFDIWFSKSLLTNKNLQKLYNYNGSFEYQYGYYFTFPKSDTPMKPINDIRDNIKDIAMACNNLGQRNMNQLSKDIKKMMKTKMFDDKESFLNQQRGKILNTNGPSYITKDGYLKFLKAHFRNGKEMPEIIHVDNNYIKNIINTSGEDWYKSFKDNIKAEEKVVRATYTTITQYIDVIRKKVSVTAIDPVDEDDYDKLFTVSSVYLNNLISITKEVNADVMLYFSCKRDAAKEMAFQNNKIIARALKGVM